MSYSEIQYAADEQMQRPSAISTISDFFGYEYNSRMLHLCIARKKPSLELILYFVTIHVNKKYVENDYRQLTDSFNKFILSIGRHDCIAPGPRVRVTYRVEGKETEVITTVNKLRFLMWAIECGVVDGLQDGKRLLREVKRNMFWSRLITICTGVGFQT
jgi:hypothetical protein